ncbi:unnamed protein product [Adineta steineri]|uniref:Uncharacterized protein n=1 Tax=Adineta steineri TaxID=433720 RepID=A0A819R2A4_9BILA|nr:unnamed protein product [Adineta steineri]CAF1453028.1 unnamed protein product [Adineta steineri]CAF4035323.1 unnamed protein product [Adineta steineri]CAF4058288.1 unnamed protein product [Adineta steineri]
MPFVKRLTINLIYMKQVAQIFQIMINLEQLHLIWHSTDQTVRHLIYPFIRNADPPFETNDFHLLQIPRTLEELHLKIEYLSLDNFKSFLNRFHNQQLKSLILIVNDTDSAFTNFDIFQNLTNNFTSLQTFEYCIRTKHRPDSRFSNVEQLSDSTYYFYTLPRPQSLPFKTIVFNQRVTTKPCLNSLENLARLLSDEVLEIYGERYPVLELTDDKIKFINLKEIRIIKKIESFHHLTDQYLSKIIRMSPNLHTIYINSCSTKKIIGHLKNILRKKFKSHLNLQCSLNSSYYGDYHTEFFYDLSKILPNLKSITFPCVTQFIYQHGTTLIDLIEDLRSYFSSLIHIRLEFDGRYTNCQQTLEIYTKELNEKHDTVGYTIISDRYSRIFLDICL